PEPVDLIDEEDVRLLEVRQEPDEIARLLEYRAGRGLPVDAQLPGHERGERGLAQPRRPVEERAVQRLAPGPRRVDRDPQALLDLGLSDELGQPARPERKLDGAFLAQDFRRRDLRTHAPPATWTRVPTVRPWTSGAAAPTIS